MNKADQIKVIKAIVGEVSQTFLQVPIAERADHATFEIIRELGILHKKTIAAQLDELIALANDGISQWDSLDNEPAVVADLGRGWVACAKTLIGLVNEAKKAEAPNYELRKIAKTLEFRESLNRDKIANGCGYKSACSYFLPHIRAILAD